jgi:hypothetical protein
VRPCPGPWSANRLLVRMKSRPILDSSNKAQALSIPPVLEMTWSLIQLDIYMGLYDRCKLKSHRWYISCLGSSRRFLVHHAKFSGVGSEHNTFWISKNFLGGGLEEYLSSKYVPLMCFAHIVFTPKTKLESHITIDSFHICDYVILLLRLTFDDHFELKSAEWFSLPRPQILDSKQTHLQASHFGDIVHSSISSKSLALICHQAWAHVMAVIYIRRT